MIDALPLLLGPEGYQISRSVRLRSSASAYLSRTPASATNRKTWTWSGWVKRGILNSSGATAYPLFAVTTGTTDVTWFDMRIISDQIWIGGYTTNWRVTTQVFRDPSAWYHIVLAVDTTQATANDRLKLYVNGVQITAFNTTNNPAQNADLGINQATPTYISQSQAQYFDGYLTEINFIDGQALDPSSFGETNLVTGVWQPKKYAGTYGTNGFFLNFSDNSAATAAAIGKDYSGNGNNWTPNNISVTAGVTYDSMLDVPTQWADGGNGRGNYATLNPLNLGSPYLSSGNLKHSTSGWSSCSGTIAISSGKWYWEVTCTTHGGSNYTVAGIVAGTRTLGAIETATLSDAYVYSNNGQKYNNNAGSAYGATWTTNDVIGVALDMDAGTLVFYKNNSSQGTAYSSLSGTYTACTGCFTGGVLDINFGQRPFTYTPPTGFKALNTLNLPTPTILKGNQYMNANLWTGDGSSNRAITGVGFQPDFTWIKIRNLAFFHRLTDSVRGATKELYSNATDAEFTQSQGLLSFDSDGFTIGTSTSYNGSGNTYVGWSWKEGATQGFDIVACATNGSGIITATNHSLGVTPSMIILKARTGTDAWYVYHKNSTATPTQGTLVLNATSAVNTTNGSSGGVDKWTINSSTFAAGNAAWFYQASTNHIAYLFSEVAGFSKAFSYTGNGSSDGPFIFCGFRPRFILTKGSSTTGSWWLYDTARSTYNEMTDLLRPDLSNADVTQGFCDSLSNGFKIRNTGNNTSGQTYIGFAWAESPFKNSLAR
jgi:hypothetical protein